MTADRRALRVMMVVAVVALFTITPRAARASAVVRQVSQIDPTVQPGDRVVALTFDDGPDPWAIPQVLDILARYGVPGTFFIPGVSAAANPDLVRRISRAGHVVAGHGWTHTAMTGKSPAVLSADVQRTDATLLQITGRTSPCQRPPGGTINDSVVQTLDANGKRTVLWSVDPWDWKGPGPAAVTNRVLSAVRPGAIVLLHPGSGIRAGTVAALPSIIEGLRDRGYRFVSICGGGRTGPSTASPSPFGTSAPWLTPVTANTPFVGAAATPDGAGARLVAADGGVFAFGDATFAGSLGDLRLNQPIVGMASTPSGNGYWLAAADGGVFAFGDATFAGSLGDLRLNQPIVGMASTPSGNGYWLAAADGGVFAFGDAPFLGSGAGSGRQFVGIAAAGTAGYRLASRDTSTMGFGADGNDALAGFSSPVTAITTAPSSNGWWLLTQDGGVLAFGDAPFLGADVSTDPVRAAFGLVPTGTAGYVELTQQPSR